MRPILLTFSLLVATFITATAQMNIYILDGDTVYRDLPVIPAVDGSASDISYMESATNMQLKRLDSMAASLTFRDEWFQEDTLVFNHIYLQKSEIPEYSAAEIQEMLNLIPAKIPMQYNTSVQHFIDAFTQDRRHFIAKALGLSQRYFPIYEEVFDREGMPIELKYLSVIESGLDPKARSHMGASGPWQFMSRTGKAYGLDVNSFVDERSDIFASTQSASNYLKDLYGMYGDWLLALAAYNAGPGNVNKALALAGQDKSFWSIKPYLPKETQNYVPLYIACVYAMTYHEEYDIIPLKPRTEIFAIDTVKVYEKVSLRYVAQVLGIDLEYLSYINPTLKESIIPKNTYGYTLYLPAQLVSNYIYYEDMIIHDPYMMEEVAEIVEKPEPKYTVYKVKSGDTLGHIAERYNVGLSKIKSWNNLKSDMLKIGQKLVLYI